MHLSVIHLTFFFFLYNDSLNTEKVGNEKVPRSQCDYIVFQMVAFYYSKNREKM